MRYNKQALSVTFAKRTVRHIIACIKAQCVGPVQGILLLQCQKILEDENTYRRTNNASHFVAQFLKCLCMCLRCSSLCFLLVQLTCMHLLA